MSNFPLRATSNFVKNTITELLIMLYFCGCFRNTPAATVSESSTTTSIAPRPRNRSAMSGVAGLGLPIQKTTITPRKRPTASNPQTPVTSSAGIGFTCYKDHNIIKQLCSLLYFFKELILETLSKKTSP